MTEEILRVPGWPLVFPLFWGAASFFALAMTRHLRVMAAAHPAGVPLLSDVPRRLWAVLEHVLAQVRMFRDVRVAVMHHAIFWGFVVLTIATANAVTGGLVQAVISWPFNGAAWAVVAALINVVSLAVIAGVAYALLRRLIQHPARLTYSRDATLILLMIGALVSAEFVAGIFESARYGDQPGAFIANAIAVPVRAAGLPEAVLAWGFAAAWWTHIVIVSIFLCYLPGSKHLHIVTSLFNVYFRKLAPRGELPAMDLEQEGGTFGLKSLADLGWKDLLDGFTCTECGRCQDACPAWNTGKVLNPKTFIMGIRDMSDEAEHGLNLIPNSPIVRETYGLDDRLKPAALARPIVDEAIPYEAVWDCVTCGACVEACPVLIEHVDKIVGLRRNLVLEESRFPPELAAPFRAMEQSGNPWGLPRSTRTDWTRGLPFTVPTVAELSAAGRLAEIEVLYWVGCAAAFDERNRRVARAFATCLDAAGVRFAILGQEESCTGDPARRMGNDYVYQVLAAGNVETLDRYGLRSIVTACPHCFNTIANEYPQLGGRYEVVHHSVYLQRLLADGRLQAVAQADGSRSITLHDSCYLARYNGVISAPRDVLGAVPGLDLREMDNHGRQTFCCGAGGGRMWMEENSGTRINAARTAQALVTGASVVATACPFCMTMLRDGLSGAESNTDGVTTADIAELLAGSLAPTPAGRRLLPVVQLAARTCRAAGGRGRAGSRGSAESSPPDSVSQSRRDWKTPWRHVARRLPVVGPHDSGQSRAPA
jgi:Fe-S oxidoreductase